MKNGTAFLGGPDCETTSDMTWVRFLMEWSIFKHELPPTNHPLPQKTSSMHPLQGGGKAEDLNGCRAVMEAQSGLDHFTLGQKRKECRTNCAVLSPLTCGSNQFLHCSIHKVQRTKTELRKASKSVCLICAKQPSISEGKLVHHSFTARQSLHSKSAKSKAFECTGCTSLECRGSAGVKCLFMELHFKKIIPAQTPNTMERYEPFPQFVKPIQTILISTFIIDIQRQDTNINQQYELGISWVSMHTVNGETKTKDCDCGLYRVVCQHVDLTLLYSRC